MTDLVARIARWFGLCRSLRVNLFRSTLRFSFGRAITTISSGVSGLAPSPPFASCGSFLPSHGSVYLLTLGIDLRWRLAEPTIYVFTGDPMVRAVVHALRRESITCNRPT